MQINLKILKQKIDEYYNKTISKDDLGKWASKGYYALMKGEYIEIEKLEIYHFVRTISTFHIKPNDKKDEFPCSEDICYTFNVRIYQNLYLEGNYAVKLKEFRSLKEIINSVSLEQVSSSQINFLIDYGYNYEPPKVLTLIDLLEQNIKDIIIENIDSE